MRPWMCLGLGAILIACSSGGGSNNTSLLLALCVRACAHIHAKKCIEAPTAEADTCENECQQVNLEAGTVCTDERAALYACTAEATIMCRGGLATTPEVTGCGQEELELEGCHSPLSGCVRAPQSDDICLQFGEFQ